MRKQQLYIAGETDTFINMCVNREVTFRNKLHITIDKSVTNFESCGCLVNQGYFSVSINDARLIDEKDNKCLPAKLFINSRQIYCNASRDDFGSVFHERVIKSASSAFISIEMNSGSEAPAMIMLSVNPQGRCFSVNLKHYNEKYIKMRIIILMVLRWNY